MEELTRAALWCIDHTHGTPRQFFIGVRDRAMLLLSTCTAFRGDNVRSLLWSDLFPRDVPMPDIGLDKFIMVRFNATLVLITRSQPRPIGFSMSG